ncbi:DUF4013 domain-containing protein [Natrarchaeobius oligotrophus]|uniref:DUF4013 domain-containing protein n=1 Tax=Natrarchaeobius chitinivorans TaxID=1679083 RepID=A0A3N6PUJ5_NATCH|nr:DUF4013 domain-containing protein [Natrarchaeobius chitinivorans]RQH03466.1 DUF4013 domain-containing protein [Natrarchaeobius chitinivorans]
MFDDPLSYPTRGPWLERTAIGSVLVLGSILVVPGLILAGYCVRTLAATLEGRSEPPAFRTWRGLATTGLVALGITLCYLLAPVIAGGALAVAFGVGGYYGLSGLAPAIGGHETLIWGVSIVAALFAALVSLAVVAFACALYYALPAALARYAETGRFRAAFDRRALVSTVVGREYFLALAVLQVVPLVFLAVAVVSLLTVVGTLAVPALAFVTALVSCRVVGNAVSTSSPGG